MANLVQMKTPLQHVEERMIEFKGLNRKDYVEEGEMSDMLNLTSDKYPYLVQRKLRGRLTLPEHVLRPLQVIPKFGCLAMIAMKDDMSIAFYYNNEEIAEVTGLSISTIMVAINTKICFFPEKTYIEIVNLGDVGEIVDNTYGSLEAEETLSGANVDLSNEDVKVTVPSSHGFVYDDAVNLVGTLYYTPSGGSATSKAANISCVVEEAGATVLTLPRESFIELTGEGATSITFSGTVSRTAPDLNHVIEWNNRLWGCSNADNVVYACKLGDPKNWHYFQGTSLDSFYAQQGTDENWSGVGVYSNHIIFFKPSSMCRVYGTAPSNFQITNTQCFGVELGSRQSVVTINDRVFYKSKIGIMAYDGGIPYCISDKFNCKFSDVVAGTEGIKYYASIRNADDRESAYELMVLDVDKALWHKEDKARFRNCCTLANRLYFIEYADEMKVCSVNLKCSVDEIVGSDNIEGSIQIANPVNASESYDTMDWSATFGPFDEYIENRKIYSKISLRLKVFSDTTLRVYISMDEGPWEQVQEYTAAETGGYLIPIVPRRCDRYSIKVEGRGYCEIKALTRRVRKGSHGRL